MSDNAWLIYDFKRCQKRFGSFQHLLKHCVVIDLRLGDSYTVLVPITVLNVVFSHLCSWSGRQRRCRLLRLLRRRRWCVGRQEIDCCDNREGDEGCKQCNDQSDPRGLLTKKPHDVHLSASCLIVLQQIFW